MTSTDRSKLISRNQPSASLMISRKRILRSGPGFISIVIHDHWPQQNALVIAYPRGNIIPHEEYVDSESK
jgi:hypothetical protein